MPNYPRQDNHEIVSYRRTLMRLLASDREQQQRYLLPADRERIETVLDQHEGRNQRKL